MAPVSLSLVVPVYSGEAYLRRLVDETEKLRAAWAEAGAPVALDELILVDDGAIDASPQLIDTLAGERPWVRPLHLSRNFGQHPATVAGILHAAGDWVVTLDEDLQHPPARIPDLLRRAVRDGLDIVYAAPRDEVHGSRWRDMGSSGSKRLMAWLSGNPHIRKANSFRLIRGAVARGASAVCTHDTYFDVALSWFTTRIATVAMPLRDERFASTGRSGYRVRTLVSHARRLLVSSHLKLLRFGALFGLLVVLASALAGLALFAYKLAVPGAFAVQGWTSLMLTVTFFGGVVVFMLGIALEYLSILVLRAHGKPLFFTIDRSRDAPLRDYFGAEAQ